MKLLRIVGLLAWFIATVPVVAADHFPVAANSVTLVVGKDGQVYASGDARPNRGDASEVLRNHFKPIAGLKEIVSVNVDCEAEDGAVALDKNGDVWMWGRNWCNIVRGKETTDQHVPFKHPGLSGISSVDLGEEHLVALHKDGRVLTIGSNSTANSLGALGNGILETPKPTAPDFGVVEVAGISDAVAIAAGPDVSFIVRRDGTVWGMGARTMFGESMSALAMYTDPNFEQKLPVAVPKRIAGLRDIKSISVGLRFAIALDRRGQVWGWGTNDDGEFDSEITNGDLLGLRKLNGLKNIVSISAGSSGFLAADSSGNVFACGENSYGLLGKDGAGADGKIQRVPDVAGAKQVVAGYYSAFAVLSNGSIMGWGSNDPSVGGFDVSLSPLNIPPTVINIAEKPAPPSEAIRAGGVNLRLIFELDDYQFQSESLRFEIDGKEVAEFDVNTESDEQEAFFEVPAGVHEYQIKVRGITEAGQQQAIFDTGVFLVSNQTMRKKFDSMVAERGLASGVEQFIEEINSLSDRVSLAPMAFTKSEPWSDQQLDLAEKKLGLQLPKSYRSLMKTSGPFQLGRSDVPHPFVSLLPVDAEQNLESFVQQILQADAERIPSGPYRNLVEGAAFTKDELSTDRVLEARKTWNKNLIVGSLEEELYLLIGESPRGKRETYSVLGTSLFDDHKDDDGEVMPAFQWTEYCDKDVESAGEEMFSGLANEAYWLLANHYSLQGVAPLVPEENGKVMAAKISSFVIEDDFEANEKLIYSISTDGW